MPNNFKEKKTYRFFSRCTISKSLSKFQKSYKKLFDLVENPAILSRDELYNEFIAEYSLSPRLIKGALPLFLWLSKEAGLEVTEEVESRQRNANSSNRKQPSKTEKLEEKTESPDQTHELSSSQGNGEYHRLEISTLILFVPRSSTSDLLIAKGGLAQITEKIEKFAEEAHLNIEKTEKSKN